MHKIKEKTNKRKLQAPVPMCFRDQNAYFRDLCRENSPRRRLFLLVWLGSFTEKKRLAETVESRKRKVYFYRAFNVGLMSEVAILSSYYLEAWITSVRAGKPSTRLIGWGVSWECSEISKALRLEFCFFTFDETWKNLKKTMPDEL